MNEEQFRKGKEIVALAKINAISSYSVFSEKFPKEIKHSTKDWDFFMTIASSHVAIRLFAPKTDEKTFTYVDERVIADLEREYPGEGERAFLDCTNYMDKSLGDNYKPEEFFINLGSWVFRNLKRNALEENKYDLIFAIGFFAVNPFCSFWD